MVCRMACESAASVAPLRRSSRRSQPASLARQGRRKPWLCLLYTSTIATTVYQLWRTNDELGAMRWVLVDIVISAVVLLAVNLLEKKQKAGGRP